MESHPIFSITAMSLVLLIAVMYPRPMIELLQMAKMPSILANILKKFSMELLKNRKMLKNIKKKHRIYINFRFRRDK